MDKPWPRVKATPSLTVAIRDAVQDAKYLFSQSFEGEVSRGRRSEEPILKGFVFFQDDEDATTEEPIIEHVSLRVGTAKCNAIIDVEKNLSKDGPFFDCDQGDAEVLAAVIWKLWGDENAME